MQEENKTNWKIRTDLAVELTENLKEIEVEEGISMEINYGRDKILKETVIRIKNEKGAKALGKPCGTYITIEGSNLSSTDESYHKNMSVMLYGRLKKMLKSFDNILVVGLGNQDVTPDALGPLVIKNLYITRHLMNEGILSKGKIVSAISPGVMGQTGMEAGEVIGAVVNELKPDIILAIDALAARNSLRLNRTIQICDTGIAPGSGVGNQRKEITEKSMGVKVIAIGVPTVISVSTIVNDVLSPFLDESEEINVSGTIQPELAEMFVTPKNVDEAVKKISYTISEAINRWVVE